MTIEQLLREIKSRSLCLTFNRSGSLVLWTPNTHVPMSIRTAIRSHSQELQRLIREGRIEVCANRDLHRKYWRYSGAGAYRCEVCESWSEVG